eukprot:gnl/MRDRNA2_/MRDRNA2_145601_c0_seq1.p1 gnl/MRDRNA2_/MRDRNA2_145601_c0~~gnl/MRDRNA2_/MRDRNA2_145601_c0_seq1.p1  ORF type:complete len:142 (+),score=11.28 gnl/MRDRNA2_/MRDRNA2_145601_c0_seq1:34-426(+)
MVDLTFSLSSCKGANCVLEGQQNVTAAARRFDPAEGFKYPYDNSLSTCALPGCNPHLVRLMANFVADVMVGVVTYTLHNALANVLSYCHTGYLFVAFLFPSTVSLAIYFKFGTRTKYYREFLDKQERQML